MAAKEKDNEKVKVKAPVEGEEKQKALDTALSQIEKQFGKGAVMKLGQNATMNVAAIPTGSLSLDIALGIGGVPRGRIIEIYGPESSGKTTVALHVVAQAQKLGGNAVFIDVEHALDPVYAKALGVDIDSLLVSQPDTGEQALEICEALVRSGAIDVAVVDSVAAMVTKAEIEGEMGDAMWACRPGSCPRRCGNSPGPSASPTRWSSSSTSCGRRSASCTATRRPPPAAGR